jgi:hypothetical protein
MNQTQIQVGDICLINKNTSSKFKGLGMVRRVDVSTVVLQMCSGIPLVGQSFFRHEITKQVPAGDDLRWGDTVRILPCPYSNSGGVGKVGHVRPDNDHAYTYGGLVPNYTDRFKVGDFNAHSNRVTVLEKAKKRPQPSAFITQPTAMERSRSNFLFQDMKRDFLSQYRGEFVVLPEPKEEVWLKTSMKPLGQGAFSACLTPRYGRLGSIGEELTRTEARSASTSYGRVAVFYSKEPQQCL